jgi:hypothetical protein
VSVFAALFQSLGSAPTLYLQLKRREKAKLGSSQAIVVDSITLVYLARAVISGFTCSSWKMMAKQFRAASTGANNFKKETVVNSSSVSTNQSEFVQETPSSRCLVISGRVRPDAMLTQHQ